MLKVIKSDERYHADQGWLDTRWHFSFDHYYDPRNLNWGALRVFNDDVIQAGQGFGSHPHRDMEIVTYVLNGELEHRDSTGNTGVLAADDVQVMSAGSGIVHSEYNHSKEAPVHLLQLWIFPRTKGRKPRWEQRHFNVQRDSKLLPVVSTGDVPGTLAIDQDAQIYLARLAAGKQVVHASRTGRKPYLFLMAGKLSLNGTTMEAGDQARVADESTLTLRAYDDSHLILLDLPEAA